MARAVEAFFQRRLLLRRSDITFAGYLDSFENGTVDGYPKKRFSEYEHEHEHVIVVCSHAQGKILEALKERDINSIYIYTLPEQVL